MCRGRCGKGRKYRCQCASYCVRVAAMSTLGISGTPDESEGVIRGLFWPSVRNGYDADMIAARGFWLCLLIAVVTFLMLILCQPISALVYCLFFVLGANGIRQGSFAAAAGVFSVYFLDSIAAAAVSVLSVGFVRVVFIALLLSNLRAAILVKRWTALHSGKDASDFAPARLNETWRDRLADQLPARIWPWCRAVFYLLCTVLIPLELLAIVLAAMHRFPVHG